MVGGTVILRNWKVARQDFIVGVHRRDGQRRPNRPSARIFNSKCTVPVMSTAGSKMIGGAPKPNTATPTKTHVTVLTIMALNGIVTNLFTLSIP